MNNFPTISNTDNLEIFILRIVFHVMHVSRMSVKTYNMKIAYIHTHTTQGF